MFSGECCLSHLGVDAWRNSDRKDTTYLDKFHWRKSIGLSLLTIHSLFFQRQYFHLSYDFFFLTFLVSLTLLQRFGTFTSNYTLECLLGKLKLLTTKIRNDTSQVLENRKWRGGVLRPQNIVSYLSIWVLRGCISALVFKLIFHP